MDLAKLEKKAIFIPTPGQTEQEYLADNFMKKGICYAQKQSEFDFEIAIKESSSYKGFDTILPESRSLKDLFQIFNEE